MVQYTCMLGTRCRGKFASGVLPCGSARTSIQLYVLIYGGYQLRGTGYLIDTVDWATVYLGIHLVLEGYDWARRMFPYGTALRSTWQI